MYVCTKTCVAHRPEKLKKKEYILARRVNEENGLQGGEENQDSERSTGQMTELGAAVQPMLIAKEKNTMRSPNTRG